MISLGGIVLVTRLTPWSCYCAVLSHTHTNSQVHWAQIERQGQRRHSVFTEHTPVVWTKAAGWQMRFVSGGQGGAMCCCCCCCCCCCQRTQYVFVCACSVLCLCICACMHVWACVCTYMWVCVFTRACIVLWGGGGGGGLMGQLCVCPICHPTLLTPRGTAGRVGGGDSFWKKESGVQRSNGQQCRSYWRARGKGHRLGVWKPIYQSIWQNSGPPLSGSASVCLIRHAHPWNYASNEKGVHCILCAHTHTQTMHAPGANVSLMHGHAVARGLIGYINTNTSLERREGKGVFCAIGALYC